MPLPLLPLGIAGLVGALAYVRHRRGPRDRFHGELTNQRRIVLEAALHELNDSAKLRALAAGFDKAGLPDAAELLRARASHRDLPKATREAHMAAFRKALACTDPAKVRGVAEALLKVGCPGASAALLEHAAGLESLPREALMQAEAEAREETKAETPPTPEELSRPVHSTPAATPVPAEVPEHAQGNAE